MQTVKEIGKEVRQARKRLGVTQRNLAMTAGTGLRFVVELEQGKETLQIGKVLDVLQALGLRLEMRSAGEYRS
jgi:y4mF family transcriptional regulator